MMDDSTSRATRYNEICEVKFRGGWIGLLAGENQTKAVSETSTR